MRILKLMPLFLLTGLLASCNYNDQNSDEGGPSASNSSTDDSGDGAESELGNSPTTVILDQESMTPPKQSVGNRNDSQPKPDTTGDTSVPAAEDPSNETDEQPDEDQAADTAGDDTDQPEPDNQAQPETTEGETTEGETTEGEATEGGASEGGASEGEASEGETTEGEMPENEGQGAEEPGAEEQGSSDEAPDEQDSDAGDSDAGDSDAGDSDAGEAGDKEAKVTLKVAGGTIVLQAPAAWKQVDPQFGMIEAEFSVGPGTSEADGQEVDEARMTLMASGGSIDQNIERWFGQFQQPDNRDSSEVAKVEELDIQGTTVHYVDISGTYTGMGGAAAGGAKDGYRMLAAIIEMDGDRNYFIKFYGPESIIEENAKAFREFLESLERE